jgi:hypothetical protein
MAIEFTQYLMPHGNKSPQFIDRPEEVESKAAAVIAAGGSFEMEMLGVWPPLPNVSITCSYDGDDIAMEVCQNGPQVITAVDAVVEKAHEILVKNHESAS